MVIFRGVHQFFSKNAKIHCLLAKTLYLLGVGAYPQRGLVRVSGGSIIKSKRRKLSTMQMFMPVLFSVKVIGAGSYPHRV